MLEHWNKSTLLSGLDNKGTYRHCEEKVKKRQIMSIFEIFVPTLLLVMVGLFLAMCILTIKDYLCPAIECKLLINGDIEEKAPAGGTLLESLTTLGYAIAGSCGGKGTCHQCKVRVLEGGTALAEIEKDIFSSKKIKEGWRLSCQCKVRDSLKLQLPPSAMEGTSCKAKVVSNNNVSTFIKELCVTIPDDKEIKYIPGDYMQLIIPPFSTHPKDWKQTIGDRFLNDWNTYNLFEKGIHVEEEGLMRAYSLASFPKEGNLLRFTVRIAHPPFVDGKINQKLPWGAGSSYVFSLKAGDEIELSGPFGESHMIDDDKELIFLIGGAGASFARSHILDLFYDKQTKRKVTLWYGARSLKENIYQEEYEALASKYKNFTYHLVLSEPEEVDITNGWDRNDPLKTGFVCNAFEIGQLHLMNSPEEALYYVCGPPMHNKIVMKTLYNYGVDSESIILDDFGN